MRHNRDEGPLPILHFLFSQTVKYYSTMDPGESSMKGKSSGLPDSEDEVMSHEETSPVPSDLNEEPPVPKKRFEIKKVGPSYYHNRVLGSW
jgi:hypothetical protein